MLTKIVTGIGTGLGTLVNYVGVGLCVLSRKHDPTRTVTKDGLWQVACCTCGWHSYGIQTGGMKK